MIAISSHLETSRQVGIGFLNNFRHEQDIFRCIEWSVTQSKTIQGKYTTAIVQRQSIKLHGVYIVF